MMENFNRLLACAPQLFDAQDLAKAEAATQPEAIDKSVRSMYEDLAKPSSLFTGKLARQDPLGINRAILGRMERLSAANLYDVTMEEGHLFSRDRRHLLLVFTTPVSMTDSSATRELVAQLDRQVAALPASVRADVVCGHLHTASNERILKRDIEHTSWIGALAFLTIFGVVFRDWRSIAMLGIPVCTAFLALPLAALCHGHLSYLVAGFGMVIVGISSDYGIYVYVVTRRTVQPARAVAGIARPMGLGLLTTLSVFVAFYFSGIDGYRQLATFAIFSIALAYLAAIFLLPHLLGKSNAAPSTEPAPPSRPRAWVLAASLALLLGLAMISLARFNTDITLLDGTERSILDAEKRFEKTWNASGSEQGILAFTGATYEEALQRSETLFDRAEQQPGNRLLSFSLLWRSEANRAANLARWNAFWTPERVASVQARLLESGKRYGFTPAAFQPFFDQLAIPATLREPLDNPLFALIKDRFVHRSPHGFTVFSFFPDTPESTATLSARAKEIPGTFCVSRRLLTESLAESIKQTIAIVTVVSLLLVVALTLLLSATWRLALISLAPAAMGVLWALGVPAALHQTLNLCHLTAAAVVFGLCVDYGIYMTDAMVRQSVRNGKTTIVLTTATSITGAGVLLFTQHPVLFAIGLTLSVGMLAGHITAIWGVPALVVLWGKSKKQAALPKAALASPLLLLAACAGFTPASQAGTETVPLAPISCAAPMHYESVSSVVMQYRWFKFPALGVISVDVRKQSFALVGMSQLGVNIFELSEKNGKILSRMPGKLLKRNPRIAPSAAADVRNMFFDLVPPPATPRRTDKNGDAIYIRRTPEGILQYRLDARTRQLLEKRFSVPRSYLPGRTVVWVVRYEDYVSTRKGTYPQTIRFKQRHLHYAITTRVKEMRIKP